MFFFFFLEERSLHGSFKNYLIISWTIFKAISGLLIDYAVFGQQFLKQCCFF